MCLLCVKHRLRPSRSCCSWDTVLAGCEHQYAPPAPPPNEGMGKVPPYGLSSDRKGSVTSTKQEQEVVPGTFKVQKRALKN